MKRQNWIPACAGMTATLAAVALSTPAMAQAFVTSNQGALARNFALPALGAGEVLATGASQPRMTLDLTNDYLLAAAGSEEILFDGESERLALQYRRGVGDGFEWGVEVPLLHVGGGFMDSFIENWHDWFGLPNGGRELAGRDRYEYRYRRHGATVFNFTQTGTSLGDVLLLGGWQWREGVALRAELKLPTGDEDQLTGGNPGGALWADAALPLGDALDGFVSAGLSVNARANLLEGQQKLVVPIGGAGLTWHALNDLDLGVQVDAHGPLYSDSELDALTRPGVQLVFGGAWHRDTTRLDVGVQEDIVTQSSPDFSIHLALTLAPE
jgi:hypothetical protein